jgi:hypothetical protein
VNISDEAVEAAAEWLPHSGDCEVRPDRDCTCWHPRLALMRASLEAAAPHMLASVADEREGDLFRFTLAQREWLRSNTHRAQS